jgi:hypothetical protein
MSEIPLLANMPVQSDFPFFHDYLLFKMLKYKTPNILPNGKTTEGLVQHGFGVMRGDVLKFKCNFSNQL